ncbi:sensor histidine kinase [Paenibacillus sp. MAH-34]|uniref:histidine kinase n=2 Tax=Paenibacillus TaxID=44249 RepID=A0ABW9UB90_9BACL|nr:sensor histidine kinase [Paenibacillus anseongense]
MRLLRMKLSSQMEWLLQVLMIAISAIMVIFFISSISGYYETLRDQCILQSCGSSAPVPPTTLETLNQHSLTVDSYAAALVAIDSGLAFLFYTGAGIILWKSRREKMGKLAMLALVAYGTTFPSLVYIASEGSETFQRWPDGISTIGWITLFLFFLLFPSGKLTPYWTLFVWIPFSLVQISSFLLPETVIDLQQWSPTARILYYLSAIGSMIYSQIYRYRKVSNAEQKQQTKWVVYGVTISFLGFFGIGAFFVVDAAFSPVSYIYLTIALHVFVSIIPLTLAFATLRHRLWDIDPLVNRTIVYGVLSLAIVIVYSASVLYLSSVFRTDKSYIISLIATSIVAILFAPLKQWLQRIVNRLMKGRHDDPFAVLVELGDSLIKPMAPEKVLDAVARTIQDALRLPHVSISIGMNGQETMVISVGEKKYDLHAFPLIHSGEELGTLWLSSRSPGEAFSSEDSRLLDVLLRQAVPIAKNIKMTAGMKLLAKDLQESRERLVLAREEERRQIRRNLHDELAPRLMSLAFNVAAAEQYIRKSPDTAIELLGELRQVIRTTVNDIRTMVHDLRPPTLDEFGLLGSIEARIEEILKTSAQMAATRNHDAIRVKLHVLEELPILPAAVEVAVYRIVTESLVNVIRHAEATICDVHIRLTAAQELQVEVIDNGKGIPIPIKPTVNGGIGLTSIRERAGEIGGHCLFERLEAGGTRVMALLPLLRGEEIK